MGPVDRAFIVLIGSPYLSEHDGMVIDWRGDEVVAGLVVVVWV